MKIWLSAKEEAIFARQSRGTAVGNWHPLDNHFSVQKNSKRCLVLNDKENCVYSGNTQKKSKKKKNASDVIFSKNTPQLTAKCVYSFACSGGECIYAIYGPWLFNVDFCKFRIRFDIYRIRFSSYASPQVSCLVKN